MSIIEKYSQIPVMYNIRHKHDTINHEDFALDYSDKIVRRNLSGFLMLNKNMRELADFLNKIFSIMIESSESIKNMFYFTHKKYYNKNGK